MKKFSLILAMILCVLTFTFTLSACDEEPAEYWLETSATFDDFIKTEIEDKNLSDGFDFSEVRELFNANTSLYGQIEDVYQTTWKVQISYLKKYSGLFKVTPKNNTNDAKKAFENFEKTVGSVKQELNEFTSNHLPTFIRDITNHTSSSDLIVKNDVRVFTRKYIDLSSSLLNLTKELTTIYTSYYEDIKTLKNGEEFVSLNAVELETYTRIATTKSMTSTLSSFIDYINNYNGEYERISSDSFLTVLNYYIDVADKANTATAEKLYSWQRVYNTFVSDQENFNTALSNISMEKLKTKAGYDVEKYAQEFGSSHLIAYVNKVTYFTCFSVTSLKSSVNTLYN